MRSGANEAKEIVSTTAGLGESGQADSKLCGATASGGHGLFATYGHAVLHTMRYFNGTNRRGDRTIPSS